MGKAIQRIVKRDYFGRPIRGDGHAIGHLQALPSAASFGGELGAGMFGEHLTYQLAGDGKKMRPVFQIGAFPTLKLYVGFMNERGRLKRVSSRLVAEVVCGDAPQLLIYQRGERIECMPVATAPA